MENNGNLRPRASWRAPWGGFRGCLQRLVATKAPQSTQDAPKDPPKSAQEPPMTAQEPPKSRPRVAQERPRAAQERPRAAQECQKGGQERPRTSKKRIQRGFAQMLATWLRKRTKNNRKTLKRRCTEPGISVRVSCVLWVFS